ncbi:26141_t:CDS:2, partial [Gigaspora rosea]
MPTEVLPTYESESSQIEPEQHQIIRRIEQKEYYDTRNQLESYNIGDQVLVQRSELQHSKSTKFEEHVITLARVTYGAGDRQEELKISSTVQLSDAQRIRSNLDSFFYDLQNRKISFQTLSDIDSDWKMQVKMLCTDILNPPPTSINQLCSYYQLGVVLEINLGVNSLGRIDNLFTAKQITLFVLFRMYDEDFSILLLEAKVVKESEFNELLNSANELLGVPSQEG